MAEEATCRSLWEEISLSSPIPPDPLEDREESDLAIIGGGILGLSSALHSVRMGLSVRLLEASEIGGAASGLNGGQVIPGFKKDPDWFHMNFGEKRGEALIRFGAGTARRGARRRGRQRRSAC